jgi:hypothetical protein
MIEQVEWALMKAQDSINNYDAESTKHYLAMARLWLGHMKRSNK